MKVSKNIDELVACRKGLSFIEVRNLIGVGINDAVDEVHQIERHAEIRFVFTHRNRARHGYVSVLQSSLHTVFTAHVVGSCEKRANGRTTQYPIVRVVLNAKCEVRGSSR